VPTDPDLDPNGAPFHFTLLPGKSFFQNRQFLPKGNFKNSIPGKNSDLFELESDTGVLKTTQSLDRESTPNLEITVRIEDSGEPKLYSDFDILVEVGDENDNPSFPRYPKFASHPGNCKPDFNILLSRSVDVIIKNFEGTFPGGEILKVRPSDLDVVGDYSCDLLEGSEAIFTVEKGCVVRAGRIQVSFKNR
jgi:protocadherin Fat 4